MRENLNQSLAFLFGHEGSYVNHPNDPGGPTKYGITHKTLAAHRGVKSVSAEQVKDLTLDEARDIYIKSYWGQSGGDLLPTGIDFLVFDMGVNAGPGTAVRILQRVLGMTAKEVDGIVGVKTADLAKKFPTGQADLIELYSAARLEYYQSLNTWSTFGKGWSARVNKSRQQALSLLRGGQEPVAHAAPPVAKAHPQEVNPWTKPETYLQGAPVLGGLAFLFDGDGPAQMAVAAVIVAAAAVALYYIVRRIRREEG